MKKSMITVATSAILGTLAFIKVKEKRSYKSFITEKLYTYVWHEKNV